jgi:hypothetical protein
MSLSDPREDPLTDDSFQITDKPTDYGLLMTYNDILSGQEIDHNFLFCQFPVFDHLKSTADQNMTLELDSECWGQLQTPNYIVCISPKKKCLQVQKVSDYSTPICNLRILS